MQLSISWSSSVSIFVTERMAIIHSLNCTVPFSFAVPLLSLAVTHCHLLSLVVSVVVTLYNSLYRSLSFAITRYHSLSLVVIHCHSLYHSLSFVVTHCTTHCHSLSFIVPCCHSMYHLSVFFYERSRKVSLLFFFIPIKIRWKHVFFETMQSQWRFISSKRLFLTFGNLTVIKYKNLYESK